MDMLTCGLMPHVLPHPVLLWQVNAKPNNGPQVARLVYNAVRWALNGAALQQDPGFHQLPTCRPQSAAGFTAASANCFYAFVFLHDAADGEPDPRPRILTSRCTHTDIDDTEVPGKVNMVGLQCRAPEKGMAPVPGIMNWLTENVTNPNQTIPPAVPSPKDTVMRCYLSTSPSVGPGVGFYIVPGPASLLRWGCSCWFPIQSVRDDGWSSSWHAP